MADFYKHSVAEMAIALGVEFNFHRLFFSGARKRLSKLQICRTLQRCFFQCGKYVFETVFLSGRGFRCVFQHALGHGQRHALQLIVQNAGFFKPSFRLTDFL